MSLANEHKRPLNGLSCESRRRYRPYRDSDVTRSAKIEGSGVAASVHDLAPSALTARPAIARQVDLGRPPAADHVALGSAALGRGAADTPSVA
ncbi:hypothetical protein B0H14DRAFT_3506147 [Mycena olivaceomarginata]|nr:hypothetical protein B0H14DRAFT_3506147 [Mycena olivaceomarginata]